MLIQPFGFLGNPSNTGRFLYIGQYYQGGYVAYLQGNYPNQTGLIIAVNDATGSTVGWQEQTYSTITGLSATYGSGQTNTTNIITQSTTATVAATLCNNYSSSFGGITYNDWFLPSEQELLNVRANLLLLPNRGNFFGVYDAPPIVSLYWTSYSNAINTANSIDFGGTNTYINNIAVAFRDGVSGPGPARVRACRYITPL